MASLSLGRCLQFFAQLQQLSLMAALRRLQLQAEPLCRMCRDLGKLTPATTCDHVNPHRGDVEAFWSGPFQSLCTPCHSSTKQRSEGMGGSNP